MTKDFKTVQLTKKSFFMSKKASMKDNQATGEAFCSQKSTSNTKNMNFFTVFVYVGHLLSSWIRIRIQPTKKINADPYGSRSTTLPDGGPIIHEDGKVPKNTRVYICFDIFC
jgi:hypothetical protein